MPGHPRQEMRLPAGGGRLGSMEGRLWKQVSCQWGCPLWAVDSCAGGVLRRRADGEGWRRKVPTLLPCYDRDAVFVPTIVMGQTGGVTTPGRQ